VVGDPDTAGQSADLEAARLEAYAIRQSFYPGARYVGRRPDGTESPSGAGTVDQVHEWLAAESPAAGAMLHLACHGFVEAGSEHPTAYLVLAGGKRLTAEELVALMARTPERAIGLVVLAACRTGLSITGYDEAYSLGTAFLAGGVRSVLSTQWSVPDSATSALMYMFHHFMHATGRPAWAALREAQLWMLDPARAVPERMPGPLRLQLGSSDLDPVVAWAAFVHWGQ
jgi:CHAT domain-containing protein